MPCWGAGAPFLPLCPELAALLLEKEEARADPIALLVLEGHFPLTNAPVWMENRALGHVKRIHTLRFDYLELVMGCRLPSLPFPSHPVTLQREGTGENARWTSLP